MDIKIIKSPISISVLKNIAIKQFGNLVKAVVDIEFQIIAIGGELHADEEQILLENGSKQKNIWGFNIYPDKFKTNDFLEFDSMINIRPSQNNLSRIIIDKSIRKKIKNIVNNLIVENIDAT